MHWCAVEFSSYEDIVGMCGANSIKRLMEMLDFLMIHRCLSSLPMDYSSRSLTWLNALTGKLYTRSLYRMVPNTADKFWRAFKMLDMWIPELYIARASGLTCLHSLRNLMNFKKVAMVNTWNAI